MWNDLENLTNAPGAFVRFSGRPVFREAHLQRRIPNLRLRLSYAEKMRRTDSARSWGWVYTKTRTTHLPSWKLVNSGWANAGVEANARRAGHKSAHTPNLMHPPDKSPRGICREMKRHRWMRWMRWMPLDAVGCPAPGKPEAPICCQDPILSFSTALRKTSRQANRDTGAGAYRR